MSRVALSLIALFGLACSNAPDEPFAEHETAEDLELVLKSGAAGLPSSFRANHVMDDSFFTDSDSVDAALVQRFFERGPYNGRRSFLASERVDGQSAAEALVAAARVEGLNPILLLARMQVEKSLIAKSQRPSGNSIDFAFGCGCHDGQACYERFRGLDKQLACAADTLRRHYEGSVAGTSGWVRGRQNTSLDPQRVTPDNHATASLYSYTPWVLEGRGGNWLVWNVTRRYALHFESLGADLGSGDAPAPERKWIGSPCEGPADCNFGDQVGSCQRFEASGDPAQGVCVLSCEGLCPDRSGFASTFCVTAQAFGEAEDFGLCTVQAVTANDRCAGLPGMEARQVDRYVGSSGARSRLAEVCVPKRPRAPEAEPPPPEREPPPAEAEPEPEPEAPIREQSAEGCGNIDALGTCAGDIAIWCEDGALRSFDCSVRDEGCGFVDGELGYYCL